MNTFKPRGLRRFGVLLLALGLALGVATMAAADSVGPITFESPAYSIGSINGQNGWQMTGAYDVAVASVSSYTAASGYQFGDQALRLSGRGDDWSLRRSDVLARRHERG
jgi:hypothetical protein